jgi:hypothetical protein
VEREIREGREKELIRRAEERYIGIGRLRG